MAQVDRTLVIGATTPVGLAVTRRLHRAGREVVGGRRWDADPEPLRRAGISSPVVDVTDRESLVPAVASCNHIVYAGAPDAQLPRDAYLRASVEAIRAVLAVVLEEEVERLIVTSTAATLGPAPDAESRRDPADEESYYLPGTSGHKFVEAAWAVEQACRREAADGRFVVMLNPSVVLGEGVCLPDPTELQASADAPVNWVSMETVATAHASALASGRPGGRYLVAGENGTLEDLYARARQMDGVTIGGRDGMAGVRYLLDHGRHLDGTKAKHVLGVAR